MTERTILTFQNKEEKSQANGVLSQNGIDKKTEIRVKNFTERNSILTDLMEVNHFQSARNMILAVCGFLLMTLIMFYIADTQEFYKDMAIMAWGGRNSHICILAWVILLALCCTCYQVTSLWASQRQKHPSQTKVLDFLFLSTFICISIVLFVINSYVIVKMDLGPIPGFALGCEQVRMSMKIYSFVIENYLKMKRIDEIKDSKDKKFICPTFNHFMYYMFAPTVIYSDSYPRLKEINWNVVSKNFFEFVTCIFIVYCAVLRFIIVVFNNIGTETFTASELVLMYVGCTIVGSILMFTVFYCCLHAWMNTMAEVMKFGDRQFYKDWWNSKTYSQYYRMWNAVIYDWLYKYVYLHLQYLGLSKQIRMLSVLAISSLFHDYIICLALGFFFPALGFVYSTVGFILLVFTYNGTSKYWNAFLWFTLFSGWGCLIFAFGMEWYARMNCKSSVEGFLQYTVPRSFSCKILTSLR